MTLITPPTIEPVSVEEAKAHLRVDFSDDDAHIARLITVAREKVEGFCNRALLTQTWLKTLDHFPGHGLLDGDLHDASGTYRLKYWIELLRPPLIGVTTLKYIAADGTLTTMDPSLYQVDVNSEPGRVAVGPNQIWPWTELSFPQPVLNAVQITYECGYGDATADAAGITTLPATFPTPLRQAMLLLIGHWYENREDVLTGVRAAAIEVPRAAMDLMWSKRASLF